MNLLQMRRAWLPHIIILAILFSPIESAATAFPLRSLQPGDSVPDLVLPLLDGGEESVLGSKDTIRVILFWGTDSEGKIERGVELLHTLQHIHENYSDHGIVVRSVNIDKNKREFLKELIAAESIAVPVLLDEEERLYGTYGLYIFPTVAIINRDGTLKTAVGYTHNISEHMTGQVEVMLGLKTEEELEKELNPEEVIEPPDHVLKAARRLNLGRNFMAKRLVDMAGIEFKKAVELDPENADAHAELGAYYVKKDELENAASELNRALKLKPDSVEAHFALGILHRRNKEFAKAIAELERVRQLDPTHLGAMRELGAVHEDMGQIEKALEFYRKTLQAIFDSDRASM